MRSYKIPVLEAILIAAQPMVDEAGEKHRQWLESLTDEEGKKKFEPRQVEWMTEMYKEGLTLDLIKACYRYIKATDTLVECKLNKHAGVIEVSAKITRDGNPYFFITDIIGAGGYNIQRFHYRYLVKTDLPKDLKPTDFLKNLSKELKLKHELRQLQDRRQKGREKKELYDSMTDEQHYREQHYRDGHGDISQFADNFARTAEMRKRFIKSELEICDSLIAKLVIKILNIQKATGKEFLSDDDIDTIVNKIRTEEGI